jgi:hypothetical protein
VGHVESRLAGGARLTGVVRCAALRIERTTGGRSGHSKAELSTCLDTGGKCRGTPRGERGAEQ